MGKGFSVTKKRFYSVLRGLRRKGWRAKLLPKSSTCFPGAVRLSFQGGRFCFCPITAVCFSKIGRSHHVGAYLEAGERLGMRSDVTTTIASGADTNAPYWEYRSYKTARRNILTALGLEEV